MSTSSWLKSQRKPELVELAANIGLEDYEGLKKAELEVALDDFMRSNSATLSDDPRYSQFYKPRRSESSPVKREPVSTMADMEVKAKRVGRRVTKAAEEISSAVTNAVVASTTDDDDDDDESEEPVPTITENLSALTRTPRASAFRMAQRVPLPPSPAVFADAIDRRTSALREIISEKFETSGVVETAHATRESLSSVVSIEALIVAFEAFFIRPEILPDTYAFSIPAVSLLGMRSPYDVKVPDLFLLLSSSFWSPLMLWLFTTLLVPLTASYFINLTGKAKPGRGSGLRYDYNFDPLVFNVAKALIVFVVFGQDQTLGGLVDLEDVARINSAVYGGYPGVLTGCMVAGLATIYEAALKH